jgi:hypothetical protein
MMFSQQYMSPLHDTIIILFPSPFPYINAKSKPRTKTSVYDISAQKHKDAQKNVFFNPGHQLLVFC